MSGPPKVGQVGVSGSSDGSNYSLVGVGPKLVLHGGSQLDTGLHIGSLGANTALEVGWRTGAVLTSEMGAWAAPQGTARSSATQFSEAFSMAGETGKLWVQGGLFAAESGGSPETFDAELSYSVRGGGFLVARQRLVLPPAATVVVLPVGGPFACTNVNGLMFGLHFTGVSGTIVAPTTVYRTFDSGNPQFPNAWSDVNAEGNVSTDGSVNSAGSATTTAKVLAQAGLKYSTSGTAYAVVDVLVSAKQA